MLPALQGDGFDSEEAGWNAPGTRPDDARFGRRSAGPSRRRARARGRSTGVGAEWPKAIHGCGVHPVFFL